MSSTRPAGPAPDPPPGGPGFPTIPAAVRGRLADRGINPEHSLALFLTRLTRRPAGAVHELIAAGTAAAPADAHDRELDREGGLSRRELQVLRALANGDRPAHIASAHGVAEHTVKGQIKTIRHKLGARTVAHAVHLAHHHLQPPPPA